MLALATFALASGNPFRAPKGNEAADTAQAPSVGTSPKRRALWGRVPALRRLLATQQKLIDRLSNSLRRAKRTMSPMSVVGLLALALLYGMIHSLGPGHAKFLIASHALSNPRGIASVWRAGGLFSVSHAGSALVFFFVFRALLGWGQSGFDTYSAGMLRVSGIMVMVAGMLILLSSLLERAATAATARALGRLSSLHAVAVVAGLVPCPGAFLILVFSALTGVLYLGVSAVVAVSVGMAVTVSVAGSAGGVVGSCLSRRGGSAVWRRVGECAHYLGGTCVVLLGLLMALS